MRQHSEKSWWSSVRRIEYVEYPTRERAKVEETIAIRRESPRFNISESGLDLRARPTIPRAEVPGVKHLVSLAQASEYCGVSTKTLRRRIADGSLPATRLGRRLIRVDVRDVECLLQPIQNAWHER